MLYLLFVLSQILVPQAYAVTYTTAYLADTGYVSGQYCTSSTVYKYTSGTVHYYQRVYSCTPYTTSYLSDTGYVSGQYCTSSTVFKYTSGSTHYYQRVYSCTPYTTSYLSDTGYVSGQYCTSSTVFKYTSGSTHYYQRVYSCTPYTTAYLADTGYVSGQYCTSSIVYQYTSGSVQYYQKVYTCKPYTTAYVSPDGTPTAGQYCTVSTVFQYTTGSVQYYKHVYTCKPYIIAYLADTGFVSGQYCTSTTVLKSTTGDTQYYQKVFTCIPYTTAYVSPDGTPTAGQYCTVSTVWQYNSGSVQYYKHVYTCKPYIIAYLADTGYVAGQYCTSTTVLKSTTGDTQYYQKVFTCIPYTTAYVSPDGTPTAGQYCTVSTVWQYNSGSVQYYKHIYDCKPYIISYLPSEGFVDNQYCTSIDILVTTTGDTKYYKKVYTCLPYKTAYLPDGVPTPGEYCSDTPRTVYQHTTGDTAYYKRVYDCVPYTTAYVDPEDDGVPVPGQDCTSATVFVGTIGSVHYYKHVYTCTPPVVADTQDPTSFTLSVYDVGTNYVTLEWTNATDNVGVTGYDVYVEGQSSKLTTITGTKFTATGLSPNTSYTYHVVAKDAAGNTRNSNNLPIVTEAIPSPGTGGVTTAPVEPTGITSTYTTENSISLSWNASPGATSYTLSHSGPTSSSGPSCHVSGTTGVCYNLSPGTSYTFFIEARNEFGASTSWKTFSTGASGTGILPFSQTYTILDAGRKDHFTDALGVPKVGKIHTGLKAEVIMKWAQNTIVDRNGNQFAIDDGNGNEYTIDISNGSIKALKASTTIYNQMFQDVVGQTDLELKHTVALSHDLEFLINGYYKIAEQEFSVTQSNSSNGLDFGYVIGINSAALTMEVKYTLYQEFYVEKTYMDTSLTLMSIGLSRYVNVPTVIKNFLEDYILGRRAFI